MSVVFGRSDFSKPTFDPQEFIINRKHIPMDELIYDLNGLTKVLQSELVTLINNDYAQFISLSWNLVGVDKMINDINTPLKAIIVKFEAVLETVNNSIEDLNSKLEQRGQIYQQKHTLKSYIMIHESIEKLIALVGFLDSNPSMYQKH